VNDGLREGAVLSPRLYNIFMADLVRQLKREAVRKPTKRNKDADIGMQAGEVWLGAHMWADDLTWLLPRPTRTGKRQRST
jgi:hypothetical protein